MDIFIDIESVPAQDQKVRDEIRASITAPAQYKKPESIAQWMAENLEVETEEKWRKTSFDGAYGHVVCIGIAIDDNEPVTLYSEDWLNGEADVLRNAYKYITNSVQFTGRQDITRSVKPVFIGHNISGFDLRFLLHRSILLGVQPPKCIPFHAKPWDDSIYDTMVQWAGVKDRVSLAKLCRVMGIECKSEMDGSQVWDYVREGRIGEVSAYCEEDVRATREVYRRMTFQ